MQTPRRASASAERVDRPAATETLSLSIHDHGTWRPAQWAGDQGGRVLTRLAAAAPEFDRWNLTQWVGDQGSRSPSNVPLKLTATGRTDRPTGFCQCGVVDGGSLWVLHDRPIVAAPAAVPASIDVATAA